MDTEPANIGASGPSVQDSRQPSGQRDSIATGNASVGPSANAMDLKSASSDRQQRFNSTSSIFITSSISKPDINEIIFCVSVVIHDRIAQGEQAGYDARCRFPFFSEDNNPLYAEPGSEGRGSRDESTGDCDGSKKKTRREIPSEETIYYTFRSVYDCAQFSSECLIVSLVYIERLIAFSQACALEWDE